MPPDRLKLADEYQRLFNSCVANADRAAEIDATIARMQKGFQRYDYVANRTPKIIPWAIIALLHLRECDLNFEQHLHNGDPLKHKTVNVPEGRPSGPGPWRWEESALDALRIDKLDSVVEWDVAAMLYNLERFNGFGYRNRGVRSPYLWGGSNHQEPGKYVRDGVFDPKKMDAQLGAAVILHRMTSRGDVVLAGHAINEAGGLA